MAAMVGLTGGIGSGKTSAAGCFAELGVQVIDADRIARELTAPGTPAVAQIRETFGAEMLTAGGELKRGKLGKAVFQSAPKRKLLEAILHPPIRAEMRARARRDAGRYCILDIPLLVESGQHAEMARVVAVACDRETRIQRLQQARNMTRAAIERVMENQASEAQRLAVADDIIDNNGGIDALAPQVRKLHADYLARFA